ncbi:MAG: aldehyde dehydrogenase family protein [Oscillatoriales cyanobacterium]|nr:MAG: aldehyde dehydrogenase family protein [Oscillatoriales cyanobacterium]
MAEGATKSVNCQKDTLFSLAKINAAIASAKKAFPGWSKTSLAARQQIVDRCSAS